jgi:cytochrome c-type biogenesis protein
MIGPDSNLYLLALPAGLISFLSPCVLPLVPPYLCFLTGLSLEQLTEGKGEERTANVLPSAAAFVAGFSTVFIALGATASVLGEAFRSAMGWTVSIGGHDINVLSSLAGVAIIAMGLHFLGAFRLAFLHRELRYHHHAKPTGLVGSYVIGLAFAFGWTPCIGPVLASILAVAAAEQSAAAGAGLLALYSVGLGIPFLLAAVGIGAFLGFFKRFRYHLAKVEMVMGGLLVLTGFMFLTGGIQSLSYWLIETFPVLTTLG